MVNTAFFVWHFQLLSAFSLIISFSYSFS